MRGDVLRLNGGVLIGLENGLNPVSSRPIFSRLKTVISPDLEVLEGIKRNFTHGRHPPTTFFQPVSSDPQRSLVLMLVRRVI